MLEFIAPDPVLACTAAAVDKQNLLHHGYPDRVSAAGNLAFPFTPGELDANEAYGFVFYNVMAAAPMIDIFSVEAHEVGGALC